ncbi:Hypothetical predicted protein, partial [Mytilus galloprovincialis]
VVDLGESIFIHAFGAYFGLAVARVLYSNNLDEHQNEGTVYHSDLFSMIGTIFLWLYWPSFNGGAASGGEQYRAVINTYLSLVACTIITFALSSIVDKNGKLEMVHIQNATLAGGVAVGSTAGMPLNPWGALVIGCLAGLLSTIGFRLITPCLSSKIKLHDTCGVHNLHGMPGVLAGIASSVLAALSSYEKWGDSVFVIFHGRAPAFNSAEYKHYHDTNSTWEPGLGRSGVEQGGYQMVALIITLAIALVGGTITGFILKLPVCDRPDGDSLFDDRVHWNISTEGYPSGVITNGERNYINSSDDPRTIPAFAEKKCVQYSGAISLFLTLKDFWAPSSFILYIEKQVSTSFTVTVGGRVRLIKRPVPKGSPWCDFLVKMNTRGQKKKRKSTTKTSTLEAATQEDTPPPMVTTVQDTDDNIPSTSGAVNAPSCHKSTR